MMTEQVLILKRIKEFALLPQSNLRLMAVLDDREVDVDKVVPALNADPGLVATLLRVVNSASAGIRDEIKSVKQAVVILGLDKLRSLVIATGLIVRFHGLPPAVAKRYWGHALQTAQWSKRLSAFFTGNDYKRVEGDEVFLCGLLHNVGELIIWQYLKPELKQIEEQLKNGATRADAELAVLGCTRADLAGELFTEWKMPKAVIESAAHSNEDLQTVRGIRGICTEALIVHMASAIAGVDTSIDALDYDDAVERVFSTYRFYLRLPPSLSYDELASAVAEDLKAIEPLFPAG